MSTAIAAPPRQVNVQEAFARIGDKKLGTGVRINSVRDVMEANKQAMFAALPKHITPERLIRVAMSSIRDNPKLLDCTPASLFDAITEAATLGLEPNGVLGHAYLVPFKTECTLIPGYKGLIDLARRSSTISTITMELVYQGDQFAYQYGDDPFIRHKPNDTDPKRHEKPITHVYAVVQLRDGGIQRKVWSTPQIDAHKEQYSKSWAWAEKGDRSKGGGKKDSAWHTAWPVMAKKTVIRDMINRGEIPVSVEVQHLAAREELYEAGRGDVIEAGNALSFDDLDKRITGTASEDGDDADHGPSGSSDETSRVSIPAKEGELLPDYWIRAMRAQPTLATLNAVWAEAEADQAMDVADTSAVKSQWEKLAKGFAK